MLSKWTILSHPTRFRRIGTVAIASAWRSWSWPFKTPTEKRFKAIWGQLPVHPNGRCQSGWSFRYLCRRSLQWVWPQSEQALAKGHPLHYHSGQYCGNSDPRDRSLLPRQRSRLSARWRANIGGLRWVFSSNGPSWTWAICSSDRTEKHQSWYAGGCSSAAGPLAGAAWDSSSNRRNVFHIQSGCGWRTVRGGAARSTRSGDPGEGVPRRIGAAGPERRAGLGVARPHPRRPGGGWQTGHPPPAPTPNVRGRVTVRRATGRGGCRFCYRGHYWRGRSRGSLQYRAAFALRHLHPSTRPSAGDGFEPASEILEDLKA